MARFQKEVLDDLYMLDLSFKWRLTKLDWTADGRLDQSGQDDMGYWYEWAKGVQKALHPLEEGSEWTKGKRDGRIALFEMEEVEKRERKRFLEIMRKMGNLNFKVAQLIEVTGEACEKQKSKLEGKLADEEVKEIYEQKEIYEEEVRRLKKHWKTWEKKKI